MTGWGRLKLHEKLEQAMASRYPQRNLETEWASYSARQPENPYGLAVHWQSG